MASSNIILTSLNNKVVNYLSDMISKHSEKIYII